MKPCKKCGETKTLDQFNKRKSMKDGRINTCKDCRAEYRRQYDAENKERLAEYRRQYHVENKERIAERDRLYYVENKERINERVRLYQSNNIDSINEYRRRYRVENKDRLAEYQRQYSQDNPEVNYRNRAKHRARKANAVQGNYLPTARELANYYGAACLVPGCTATVPTLDHVIPLSKGGDHGLWNMQPLCKSHNSGKNGHHTTDYRTHKWLESWAIPDRVPTFPKEVIVSLDGGTNIRL